MARRFRHETIKDRLPVPTRVTKLGCDRLEGAFRQPPGNFPKRGTAWWAREDSNLQPDRYERPALTIELRALASAAERPWPRRCPLSHTMSHRRRQSPGVAVARRPAGPGRDSSSVRERGSARMPKRSGRAVARAPVIMFLSAHDPTQLCMSWANHGRSSAAIGVDSAIRSGRRRCLELSAER
jgi:hypothetical protein